MLFNYMHSKARKVLWAALLCLLAACSRLESSIPDMPVYVERNLNTINCLFPGNYFRLTSPVTAMDRIGFGGILLVCAFDGQYYAFDLACPVECNSKTKVGAPDDLLISTCPVCGERYDMSFGLAVPTQGLSKEPLRRYRVTVTQDNNVLIQ